MATTVIAGALAFAPIADAVHAQDDVAATEDDDSDNTGLLGLAGLAGLLGLLGLKRRDDRRNYSTGAETRRVP